MEVTKEVQPSAPQMHASSLTIECNEGLFAALTDDPLVSSDRKRVYHGEFYERGGDRYAAMALVFDAHDASFYGREVAALSRSAFVGFGPAVYEFAGRVCAEDGWGSGGGADADRDANADDGTGSDANTDTDADENYGADADATADEQYCPVIVEEDAGVSLEDALFRKAEVPGTPDNPEWARPLAQIGSVDRDTENAKIIFDLRVQLRNIHEAGFYHRDVRTANVCLRRFGAAPEDIRATLIDHELTTDYCGVDVPAAARRYEQVLFDDLLHSINTCCDAVEPTSLMRDLGYLAAVEFECCNEQRAEQAKLQDIDGVWVLRGDDANGDADTDGEDASDDVISRTSCSRPIFSYDSKGKCVIHMIDSESDIVPLAKQLGLTPADAQHFPDPYILLRIHREIHHGGFLDTRDLAMISHWSAKEIDEQAQHLARDVVYERWVQDARDQGRNPEYEGFEDQPEILRTSNVDQVRDIPNKIRMLGYRIVPVDCDAARDCLKRFSPAEVEYAAYLEHQRWMNERLDAGWVYGEVRDDDLRVHPDLVPYDKLPENVKDYDRQAAANMIDILQEAGLAVVR